MADEAGGTRKPKVIAVALRWGALKDQLAIEGSQDRPRAIGACFLCGYAHIPQICPSNGCTACCQLWHADYSCGRRRR